MTGRKGLNLQEIIELHNQATETKRKPWVLAWLLEILLAAFGAIVTSIFGAALCWLSRFV